MLNGNQTAVTEGFDFFKLDNFLSDEQRAREQEGE